MSQPGARKERKVVTVLFADLVGFTARAGPLDPEDVEAILEPYHALLRYELERFGGTVEKFIGDAVVAIFGAPVAHEDDPERAVRAALAIRDAMVEEGGDLELRIAVNTGEALLSLNARAEAGEHFASGDVLNTASRLQAAAPVNGILVAEPTYRATRQVIEYGEHKPVIAKGKPAPLPVWEALDARSRFRPFDRELGPLVGRRRELDLLLGALARVREEHDPQLVTVIGVPGIGKSRLVSELAQAVEPDPEFVNWRWGRSLPYGEGVTFWALEEMVKTQAGILETDRAEQVETKLGEALADLFGEARERQWVEGHLRPLVGLGSGPELGGDLRTEAFAAWRRFFEALAERRPLVLAFEDLHWADEGLLDFVDHVVDWASGVPILVVATARPELLARRPGWGGGKPNALTISLSPLSDEETAQLVGALLERSVMRPEVQQTLLERAGGNPLYAEEFVRMLVERDGEELALPEAVQGIIAARLDTLPREEKELLQCAAVVGDVFWSGAITSVSGDARGEVDQRLHALERKQFVRPRRRASVAGEMEFAFSHALIREVAYDQIPRARRAEKHSLVAKWIDSLGRPEDHAELVAHHCLRALEYGRSATQESAAVAERARRALRDAGDRALALSAFAAAAAYYEQALALSSEHEPERPRLLFAYAGALYGSGAAGGADALEHARSELYESGDIESAAEADALLADIWWDRGQPRQADESVGRALTLIHDRPPSPAKARVLGAAARARMRASEYQEAIDIAREAMALAEAFDLQDLRADTLITVGTARWIAGDLEGTADLEHGLQVALEHNALSAVWRGYNNLAIAVGATGDLSRHDELLGQAVELANRLGARDRVRFVAAQLIWAEHRHGNWDDALRLADDFIAECEAGSPHRQEQGMRLLRAKIHLARGDVEAALADCEQALALARDSHDLGWLSEALGNAVEIYTNAGRLDEARALADEVFSYDPASDLDEVVCKLAWHAARIGLDRRQLRPYLDVVRSYWRRIAELVLAEEFEELADRCGDLGLKDLEADARVRAAEALLEKERPDEASTHIRRALEFFRSVDATALIRRAERLSEQVEYARYPGSPRVQERRVY